MRTFRVRQQAVRSTCIVLLFCLIISTSDNVSASSGPEPLLLSRSTAASGSTSQTSQDIFLEELAKDTWNYLHSNLATNNHLPRSWHSSSGQNGDYANVAEIGFYALSWITAYDLQRPWSPNWTTTEAEVTAILNQLRAWQTGSQPPGPNGENAYNHSVFYQWYWINQTPPVVGANSGDNQVVPSIDNALLAASLITIREYAEATNHAALAQKANTILDDMDFTIWYHYDVHLFSLGAVENPQGGGWADYFSNETRIINFVAHALGQLSDAEFQLSLSALNKQSKTYNGITVERVAWDGSYFTYTVPTLFIREMDTQYGSNTIVPATQTQIQYAAAQDYEAWGLSDTYDPNSGQYVQQGAPPVAMPNPPPQCPAANASECVPGLVSPHASALALITPFAPQAIANLQKIAMLPGCYDASYGFHNSVQTKAGPQYGDCSERFYALEQEWIFLAIAAYKNGLMWNYFYRDPGVMNTHAQMYDRTIAGTVNVAGALLNYTAGANKSVTSQPNGMYSLKVLNNWSGSVTPTHACYTFTPANRNYSNIAANQASQNYSAAIKPGCADLNISIGGTNRGRFGLPSPDSTRASFPGISGGPVKLTGTRDIVAAERVIYRVNGLSTSFTEMMGLPESQIDTTYYLPWYNNKDLDTQLRIANVGGSQATVTITIGGVPQPSFNLPAGVSTRVSYPINNGPVKIVSTQDIVAAERVIYKVNGVNTSFSEMMALPANQLDTTYWLPWYNNRDLDTQLRIANVSGSQATVTVTIGGVPQPSFNLPAGVSTRVSYPVNNGPVKIASTQNIVAAERVIYKVNGRNTSFTEMMAMPESQLDTTYWLPWYNNADLDTQLRIANVSGSQATVTVTIGGVAQPSFNLPAGASTRISYPANNGPVKIVSTQDIVAAERVIYKINNVNTSFSEMMGLPDALLDTTYWLPWYNNRDLDTQLRFGVP